MAEDTTTRNILIAVVAIAIIGAGAWFIGMGSGGGEGVVPPAEEAPPVTQ